MTCADKLRDLHAEYAGCPNPDGTCMSCSADFSMAAALPEIAAVIEAAEKAMAFLQANEFDEALVIIDSDMIVAYDALARRLETQP